jgi:hypothetical protein
MLVLDITGNRDDQDPLTFGLGSYALDYLVSIHSGQSDVQQYRIRVQRSHRANRFLAIIRDMDRPSGRA